MKYIIIPHTCYDRLFVSSLSFMSINPLTPNDHYSGRTARLPLNVAFDIFIQQI